MDSAANDEAHGDWFLQHLVTLANRHHITFPVTLQMSGFIVSGSLIGGSEYFDSISQSIEAAMKDKSAHWVKFAKSFASFGAPYSAPADEDGEEPAPRYFHLKNVRVVADAGGASLMGAGGVLWRGRIDAVSGLVLGVQPPAEKSGG